MNEELEIKSAKNDRNMAIMIAIVVLMVMIFIVTLIKMGG
jgi:hypothetical protein